MAKITDNTFRAWRDAETISADEYKKEREVLRVAVNDNDTRIGILLTDLDTVEVKANALDTRLAVVENVSDNGIRTDLDAHTGNTDVHLGSLDRTKISRSVQGEGQIMKLGVTGTLTVSNNTTLDTVVNFPVPYLNTPNLQITPFGNTAFTHFLDWTVFTCSKNGFTIRVRNDGSLGANGFISFHWLAIGN